MQKVVGSRAITKLLGDDGNVRAYYEPIINLMMPRIRYCCQLYNSVRARTKASLRLMFHKNNSQELWLFFRGLVILICFRNVPLD
jgi:hypothetical protein